MKTYKLAIIGEQCRVVTSDGEIFICSPQELTKLIRHLASLGYARVEEVGEAAGYIASTRPARYSKGASSRRDNSTIYKRCK